MEDSAIRNTKLREYIMNLAKEMKLDIEPVIEPSLSTDLISNNCKVHVKLSKSNVYTYIDLTKEATRNYPDKNKLETELEIKERLEDLKEIVEESGND